MSGSERVRSERPRDAEHIEHIHPEMAERRQRMVHVSLLSSAWSAFGALPRQILVAADFLAVRAPNLCQRYRFWVACARYALIGVNNLCIVNPGEESNQDTPQMIGK